MALIRRKTTAPKMTARQAYRARAGATAMANYKKNALTAKKRNAARKNITTAQTQKTTGVGRNSWNNVKTAFKAKR